MEPVRSGPDLTFHHAWVDEIDIPNKKLKLMPAYPPAFREVDPLLPADQQQQGTIVGNRLPHAVPPHAKNRVPESKGGYGTTFKKPAHRRDVEGHAPSETTLSAALTPSQPPATIAGSSGQQQRNATTIASIGTSAINPDVVPQLTQTAIEQEQGRHYEIEFDRLIITVGAFNATYSIPGVAQSGWFLKDAQNARSIRWRILETLEQASHPE